MDQAKREKTKNPYGKQEKKGKTKEKQKGVKKAEVHKSCFKHPKAT